MFSSHRLDRRLPFLAEHVPIEEEQGVEGRVLGRGGHLPLDGQRGKDGFYLTNLDTIVQLSKKHIDEGKIWTL